MKHVWPALVAALVLSSCISVRDFAAYWDKGYIDPALEGTWQKVGSAVPDLEANPGPATWRFTRNVSTYEVQGINPVDLTVAPEFIAIRRAENDRRLSARSLRIGRALFLMLYDPARQRAGLIARYEIQGTTLREYRLENGAAADFLTTKYPAAKNIRKNAADQIVIEAFDEEVFRVLSEMVENPTYWRLHGEYKRQPPADWTSELAVRPGSSLPPEGLPQRQIVTLFEVSQQREVESQFFIAGVGYVTINGGASILAGMNRALDPFVELTIADRRDPVLPGCRSLLVPASFARNAVQISGTGHFTTLPGLNERRLVVLRLEKLSECKLVPRG